MSEDKEGLKGTSLVARSGGEQVRWRTIQKVTRQEWGPSSIPHHSGPPPLIKGRMAKGVRNRLSIVDLGTLILAAREMRAQFWTPPPPLKGRMAGGLRNPIPTVDLGTQILAVQICSLHIQKVHLHPKLRKA
jgi:hypothetical protein